MLVNERAKSIYNDPKFKAKLGSDGFAFIGKVIHPSLLQSCLKRINQEIGSVDHAQTVKYNHDGSIDRSNHVSSDEDITNVFNLSPLKPLMALLFGEAKDSKHYHMTKAHVALSFPDDHTNIRFDQLASKWRLEGLTQVHAPVAKHHEAASGSTSSAMNSNNSSAAIQTHEHLWEFATYDALVGVFIREVPEGLGELCVFPGSHLTISQHLRDSADRLDEIRVFGPKALHKGGALVDEDTKTTARCLGAAGDAFIANSLLALFDCLHFLPEVRYMVLFRVRGSSFASSQVDTLDSSTDTLLHPLRHWKLT